MMIDLVDEATGARTPLYENFDYENPLALKKFDAPISTRAGQSLEWTCTYRDTKTAYLQGARGSSSGWAASIQPM
jgi:hypothetical protein